MGGLSDSGRIDVQPLLSRAPSEPGGGARVLLVEDDLLTREVLGAALMGHGYEVCADADGAGAESLVRTLHPDIALIDLHLGDGADGIAVARRLRASSDLPILFVSGANELESRLAAFAVGGDDYVVKPFSIPELVVRMQAILRRSGAAGPRPWRIGDLEVDPERHLATRAGRELNLTKLDFDLLLAFCRHRGCVLSKAQLLDQVWGFEFYDPNVVEVHVSSLRRKLEKHGERVIHTIRGVGYVLRAGEEEAREPA